LPCQFNFAAAMMCHTNEQQRAYETVVLAYLAAAADNALSMKEALIRAA